MSTRLSAVGAADRGPSGRVSAAVLVVTLALVASIGVLGNALSPAGAPISTAPLVAAPSSRGATPVPASSGPSASSSVAAAPEPTATPRTVSGEGVPTVTRSSATLLSGPSRPVWPGNETLWRGATSYSEAVVDGQGIVWAFGGGLPSSSAGPLARYDPRTGETAMWSMDDDDRFAANEIVPSGAGGVWLVAGPTLRRFDGSDFREAYLLPAQVTAATEAADGSVWAASSDGALVHLAGAVQTRIDALAPAGGASITSLAVDARGDVWCAWAVWTGQEWRAWFARYDGAAWRVFDDGLGSAAVTALIALPDGSVWAATGDRLARFDGSSWTAVDPSWAASPAVAAGPDGTLWVAAGNTLGRYAGLTWRPYGPIDMVTEGGQATSLVRTRDGLFVAVGGSLYRRGAGHWQRVLAARSAPSSAPELATALLAVSRDEAWVGGWDTAGRNAMWHAVWHAGAWSAVPIATRGDGVQRLLRTPDGSLWVSDVQNVASVLRGSTWTRIGVSTGGFARDREGLVWVADTTTTGMTVRAYALEHGKWVETGRTAWTDLVTGPSSIAVGPDGTIWVVGAPTAWGPDSSGLARYVGGAWALVDPPAGHVGVGVTDLAVGPDGDVWLAGADFVGNGAPPQDWIGRFDGRTWTVFQPAQALGPAAADVPGWYVPAYNAIACGAEGTVWVAGKSGLFRYDGRAWTTLFPGVRFSDVSVADDGTVWVIGPSGVARLGTAATSP